MDRKSAPNGSDASSASDASDVSGARDAPDETVEPYSALAAGYDFVMDHVDYDGWAHYVHELVQIHHPMAQSIFELGCGTGSLAYVLQPLGGYDYRATDASKEMIEAARRKKRDHAADISFGVADFISFNLHGRADILLLLYDGLNYLLEEEAVDSLLIHAVNALNPDGIFIVDQSTPVNSESHLADFEDESETEGFRYERTSSYERDEHLHTTCFDIWTDGRHLRERHVQRAYTMAHIAQRAKRAGFEVAAAYDNFSRAPADDESARIHWVLRKL